MASLPGPESRDVQQMVHHLKWSHAEKRIARKAFELALVGLLIACAGVRFNC